MYQLTHHNFGKVEILSEFDKYPTHKQVEKVVPNVFKKGDRCFEKLCEKKSLAIGIGEWLEISEVKHDI